MNARRVSDVSSLKMPPDWGTIPVPGMGIGTSYYTSPAIAEIAWDWLNKGTSIPRSLRNDVQKTILSAMR